jgi:S-DNA-T family DNA segregation ATPase FtsK/SpoIIIE
MAIAERTPAPLPGKIARLLRESKWLLIILAAVYVAMVLLTYDRADPGWSHSATVDRIHNAGGRIGAWVADILLYLFGLSAYWLVVLCLYGVAWGYRRLDGSSFGDRRPFIVALAGFSVLLFASSGLEALRFHSLQASLPLAPGGMLGAVLSNLF